MLWLKWQKWKKNALAFQRKKILVVLNGIALVYRIFCYRLPSIWLYSRNWNWDDWTVTICQTTFYTTHTNTFRDSIQWTFVGNQNCHLNTCFFYKYLEIKIKPFKNPTFNEYGESKGPWITTIVSHRSCPISNKRNWCTTTREDIGLNFSL